MPKSLNDIEFVILAGGKSQRMGRDKGLVIFQNKRMIEHSIETILNLSKTLSISTNNTDYMNIYDNCFTDKYAGEGPIGGMLTALERSPKDWVFFVSCDSPLLTEGVLLYLLDHSNALANVANVKGRIEPLIGLYHKTMATVIKQALDSGERSIKAILQNIDHKEIVIPAEWEHQFTNFNTPDDLKNYL